MSLLRLQHVTRRFGGLVAVDDVSLEIAAHGVTAIIGPNGAGKTTLFNVISGFDAPSAGRVLFAGDDITGLAPEAIARRGLVRTFQLAHLFDDLTVLENVKVGRHLHTRGGPADGADAVPRGARRDRRGGRPRGACWNGSGSRRRPTRSPRFCRTARSGSSRSPARSPPSRGCSCSTSRPRASIATRRPGSPRCCGRSPTAATAVLLIEHDMSLVMNVAARIAVLDFGRLIAEGTPSEVQQNRDVIAAYLGTAEAAHA